MEQKHNIKHSEFDFWEIFLNAVNCEFREAKEIQGASGIKHKVLCIGVDNEKKRIVIVQDEQDARILAMTQADIQAKIKGFNVLMVRPVPMNIATAVSAFGLLFGTFKLTQNDFKSLSNEKNDTESIVQENKNKIEDLLNTISPQIEIIQKTKLNIVPIIKELVQQLSHVTFLANSEDDGNFSMDFEKLLGFNPLAYDTTLGICPIPLYDFSVNEAEIFLNGNDIEGVKGILKEHSIYQFFYPPADALALGFIENETLSKEELLSKVKMTPEYGHPFGKNELTNSRKIIDIIENMRELGLVTEGEFETMVLTEDGVKERLAVKFRPRESIFKRISNLISIKVDINIKDLFHPRN